MGRMGTLSGTKSAKLTGQQTACISLPPYCIDSATASTSSPQIAMTLSSTLPVVNMLSWPGSWTEDYHLLATC